MINMLEFIQFLVCLSCSVELLVAGGDTPDSVESKTEAATIASVDGSPIYYGVRGQGTPAIVFVHCWTCNHEFWTPQIEYFSADHQVIWLDLAGHGKSGSRRQRYTMQAFGQDVAEVVSRVGVEKVVIVGHSMGGPVALEAAKLLGDRVIGIVGVDTFYTPFEYPETDDEVSAFVEPFETDFSKASEKLMRSMFTPHADVKTVEWILTQLSGSDEAMGVSAMHEIFSWNAAQAPGLLNQFSHKLRNINAAPGGNEHPLHESVILVPGVGHFIPQVKPVAFNRVLESIIAGF